MYRRRLLLSLLFSVLCVTDIGLHELNAQEIQTASPSRTEAIAAMRRATEFFTRHASKHGGYVYRYSRDFALSEGEAETDLNTIWVQPPGTPAVGMAFLDAYDATDDEYYLRHAVAAAEALVSGQMQSGGWYYSIHFDSVERPKWGYRDNPNFKFRSDRRNKTCITTLDDDTTPAALRMLMQIDRATEFVDNDIHKSTQFAIQALLNAQVANGGWAQNWDRFPDKKPIQGATHLRATIPKNWSRTWDNDWTGKYYLNDDVAGNMLRTMLLAYGIYKDPRCLESAKRTGDFLLLAQLPAPQPAWAQQYNAEMQPCWDRKFEPPAISSWESQMAIAALLQLFNATGEVKYLKPIEPALDYLDRIALPDGLLARFYEFETDKPLYFTREYHLTYSDGDVPEHYGFKMPNQTDKLRKQYQKAMRAYHASANWKPIYHLSAKNNVSPDEVREIIGGLNSDGGWLDRRSMKGHGKASADGVYQSETFSDNIAILSQYIRQLAP